MLGIRSSTTAKLSAGRLYAFATDPVNAAIMPSRKPDRMPTRNEVTDVAITILAVLEPLACGAESSLFSRRG
jgi:pyruvate kinase